MLKQGNPEISDLSDENRPTSIGQKFKEVYEDEWTDAFTFLTDDRPQGKFKDEDAVALLYNLLQVRMLSQFSRLICKFYVYIQSSRYLTP